MFCTLILRFQTLLHGSPEAKKEGEVEMLQHSKRIARGKYVHAFEGMYSLDAYFEHSETVS